MTSGDPLDLDQIERALKDVSRGPWREDTEGCEVTGPENHQIAECWGPECGADAFLIAHAPKWLAALCGALRDARQRVTQEEAARREDLADLEIALQRAEKAEAALAAAAEREEGYREALENLVHAVEDGPHIDGAALVDWLEPLDVVQKAKAALSPTPTEPHK